VGDVSTCENPEAIDGIADAKQRVSVSIRGNARFKI
jgi:hypothetical protein